MPKPQRAVLILTDLEDGKVSASIQFHPALVPDRPTPASAKLALECVRHLAEQSKEHAESQTPYAIEQRRIRAASPKQTSEEAHAQARRVLATAREQGEGDEAA